MTDDLGLNSPFPDLDPPQADGRACVICGDFFAISGAERHSVTESFKGYEIFACKPDCLVEARLRCDEWERWRKSI
jgi:hypothetical protein